MPGIEAVVLTLALAWLATFLFSSVRLVRAQTPQEHDAAMRILTGCIIGGIIVVIGPEIGKWMTGLKVYTLTADYTSGGQTLKADSYYYTGDAITSPAGLLTAVNAGRCLPSGTGHVIDTVVNLLRITGGLVVMVGLIWGGISLRTVRARGRVCSLRAVRAHGCV